jgi:hypothetical protein
MKKLLLALLLCLPTPRDESAKWAFPIDGVRAQDMTDEGILQFGLDRLHRNCQPDGPVGVVREDLDEMRVWGYTERMGPGWMIHLNTSAHGEFLLSILAHEYAHCLSWRLDDDDAFACGGHGCNWESRGAELIAPVGTISDPRTCARFPCREPAYRKKRRAGRRLGESQRHRIKYVLRTTPCAITRMRIAQMDRCAVCRCRTTAGGPTHSDRQCVDHDHATGKIRELLCHHCNCALGLLKESPERILGLLHYLQKHKEDSP